MKRNTLISVSLGALAVCLTGCGGSTGAVLGVNTNPRIRLADFINTPATTSLMVDTTSLDTNATFGFSSSYQIFPNGSHTVQFNAQSTNAQLVNLSPYFSLNEFATIIAYNTSSNTYGSMLYSDVPNTIDQLERIRVVNAAGATGPVDVYITLPGTNIASAPATVSDVNVGDQNQQYVVESSPATYEITVTTPGTKTVLATYTMTSPITAGQSQLFVVGDNAGGTPSITPLQAFTY